LPRDLRHVVEEAIKRTSSSARLDYLCALPESVTAADCGRELWLAELLSQVTVLDLHRLEIEENQRVAASFFLQRLYREMFGRVEVRQLGNAVVFDEAHRGARLTLIPKMMQECRKYGILFMLSSQRIEDFNQGVLDSAGNHLYLRVHHPDARRLASYLAAGGGAGDIAQKLQNLPKYHALYRSEDYQPFAHVRLAEP
jgi:DNA helicase HerA-like ATPase